MFVRDHHDLHRIHTRQPRIFYYLLECELTDFVVKLRQRMLRETYLFWHSPRLSATSRVVILIPHIEISYRFLDTKTGSASLSFCTCVEGGLPVMAKPSPSKRAVKRPLRLPSPVSGDPLFGEPQPSSDPTKFRTPHGSDTLKYNELIKLLQQVPLPRGGAIEPVLTLAEVYGSAGSAKVKSIQSAGQIVFHSVGDTGSVRGPNTQSLVADKMVSDFTEQNSADIPSFFFHLGDVVYSFGEAMYYYDQFYEPYREYQGPVVAIPGNHDGMIYTGDSAPTLDAFLRNFCAAAPDHTPEAGGLQRTAMIAPGAYFTFDAPFVRILGLYSNVLEDPGVISSQGNASSAVDDRQLAFLVAALKRAKQEKFAGAVIVAMHHPPFTYGTAHGGSPRMLQDLDQASQEAGFWPHAYFSAHAHNYQRYTRS